MKKAVRKREKVRLNFFANKKTLSITLGICLAVLVSAYITNARYSADSSVNLPTGTCIKGSDRSLMPSYTIKVVNAEQKGISGKKIVVRAPLFTYNPDKKTWNDPLSAKDYVSSVGTVVTNDKGIANVEIPYCTIGNKYFLGENNKIFRSINFYLENVNLPAQNVSDFFDGGGSSLSGLKKIGSNTEPIIFTVYGN